MTIRWGLLYCWEVCSQCESLECHLMRGGPGGGTHYSSSLLLLLLLLLWLWLLSFSSIVNRPWVLLSTREYGDTVESHAPLQISVPPHTNAHHTFHQAFDNATTVTHRTQQQTLGAQQPSTNPFFVAARTDAEVIQTGLVRILCAGVGVHSQAQLLTARAPRVTHHRFDDRAAFRGLNGKAHLCYVEGESKCERVCDAHHTRFLTVLSHKDCSTPHSAHKPPHSVPRWHPPPATPPPVPRC